MRARRGSPVRAALLAAVVAVLAPTPARALHATAPSSPGALQLGRGAATFSLDASIGLLDGQAVERVFGYPLGAKYLRSELTWDVQGVALAGVRSSLRLGRRVRVNLGLWSALSDGSGTMIDRDWRWADAWTATIIPDDGNWTDESRHPDTTVEEVTVLDLNLSVLALESGPFSLSGIVGLKKQTVGWSARGGTFVYSSYGYRDSTGSFEDGVEVISYEQQYTVPYAGIGMAWSAPGFSVETHALLSLAVSATDDDYHALRDQYFHGEFSGGTYVGLGLSGTWNFSGRWAATLGLEYQSIAEITGDASEHGAEGSGSFAGGAGLAMHAVAASLGIGCRL